MGALGTLLVVGLSIGLVGGVFLQRGVHHSRHRRPMVLAVGTVVRWSVRPRIEALNRRVLVPVVPVVRFRDRSGQVREGVPRHYTRIVPPRTGSRVDVGYDADDPGWWVLGTREPSIAMYYVIGAPFTAIAACLLLAAVLVAVLPLLLA